jgi:hypothetical protein
MNTRTDFGGVVRGCCYPHFGRFAREYHRLRYSFIDPFPECACIQNRGANHDEGFAAGLFHCLLASRNGDSFYNYSVIKAAMIFLDMSNMRT